MIRPNFLGIGVLKAGTTWLANRLRTHPDVFIPERKELNFLHYEDVDQRWDEYFAYFRNAGSATAVGEFSPRYFASPRAPARAAAMMPAGKLIVVFRDPVGQIASHYWHLRRQNFHQPVPIHPAPGVLEALERFPDLLLEPLRYGSHLGRWLEYFPMSRILAVLFDEIADRPDATLATACRFLGVDPGGLRDERNQAGSADRLGVAPRGDLAERVYLSLYGWITRGPYRLAKKAFGADRAEAVKERLRLRSLGESLFFRRGYPALDRATAAAIRERFAPEVRSLSALIGRDLHDWLEEPIAHDGRRTA